MSPSQWRAVLGSATNAKARPTFAERAFGDLPNFRSLGAIKPEAKLASALEEDESIEFLPGAPFPLLSPIPTPAQPPVAVIVDRIAGLHDGLCHVLAVRHDDAAQEAAVFSRFMSP